MKYILHNVRHIADKIIAIQLPLLFNNRNSHAKKHCCVMGIEHAALRDLHQSTNVIHQNYFQVSDFCDIKNI